MRRSLMLFLVAITATFLVSNSTYSEEAEESPTSLPAEKEEIQQKEETQQKQETQPKEEIQLPQGTRIPDVTLGEAIQKALAQNLDIAEQSKEVDIANAYLEQAKAESWPGLSSYTIAAPIYEERGNAVTTVADFNHWGPLFKGEIQTFVPVYTFGRLAKGRKAARHNITARKEQVRMTRFQVIYDVKEIYYGAQMAMDGDKKIIEAEDKLKEIIERVEELLKEETGEVTKQDLYKLKVMDLELKQHKEEVKKGVSLAQSALAFKMGYEPGTAVAPKEKKLSVEKMTLHPLEHYVALALKERPELLALQEGIAARDALVTIEKRAFYPMFFIGALFDWADTPDSIRNRQPSPYANDPFNTVQGGGGFGFKWDLDFFRTNAKISLARSEHDKLVATQQKALQGIPLQVKKAYLEFKEAEAKIALSKKQTDNADKWVKQAAFVFLFGLGDSNDVIDAFGFKALSDKNYIESIFKNNIALAALSQSIGSEVAHIEY